MAQRLLNDPEADGWERSDFPIVCETCLGPNPYVRMQRVEYGGQCHISGRPYTVFRWRPGNDARYKKTIICQEVAKAKNVCQVCLLDLDYNLPVQVRDTALGLDKEDIPQSDVGKEFALNERVQRGEQDSSFGGAAGRPNDLILKLQRTTPYYKRNMAQICSFFVRGQCNRGAECPYRHEMPTTGELAEQNIKDRYYGINDPVANKMLRRAGDMPKLEPPDDKSITTLYIGGVGPDFTEADLRDQFYSYGEVSAVRMVPSRFCAFVTFSTREAAERAAEEKASSLVIKGTRLKVMWGRPQQDRQPAHDPMAPASTSGSFMVPPAVAMQQQGGYPPAAQNYFGLAPAVAAQAYPSMDPSAMGSRPPPPHGDPSKRGPPDGSGPDGAKRARTGGMQQGQGQQAGGSGYGFPGMPPQPFPVMMMQPLMPMGPPPPMYGMPVGGPGMARPPMMQQPMMQQLMPPQGPGQPPVRGPMPPPGAPAPASKAAEAPAAAAPPAAAPAPVAAAAPAAAAAGDGAS